MIVITNIQSQISYRNVDRIHFISNGNHVIGVIGFQGTPAPDGQYLVSSLKDVKISIKSDDDMMERLDIDYNKDGWIGFKVLK